MTEIAEGGAATVGSLGAAALQPKMESDFSPRKLKIAAGILMGQTFATSILPYSALMLMLMPLTMEFGWNAQQFSWSVPFLFACGGLSVWTMGRLTDKIGARPVILTGTIIVGIITLAMALQTASLWQFYIVYALLGIFGSSGLAYSKVVAATFTQHRGKAMAFLTAESNFARAGIALVVNWLLLGYGWRSVYWVFGAVILLMVPILYFTLEEPNRPRSLGPQPDAPVQPPVTFEGMSVREALRSRAFWLMLVAVFIGLFIFNGLFPHLIPALIGKGFDQTTVVEVQSATLVISVLGALVGGWLTDRYDTAKVAVPFCLLSALGTLIIVFVTPSFGGATLLAISLAFSAFSFNAMFPMGMYFPTRFFGLRSFAEIVGVMFTFTNLFAGLSAPLFGFIFDQMHSYDLVFWIVTVLWVIAAVCWYMMPPYKYAKNIGQLPAAVTGPAEREQVVIAGG